VGSKLQGFTSFGLNSDLILKEPSAWKGVRRQTEEYALPIYVSAIGFNFGMGTFQ
jgi:hypothetical protein